MQGIHLAPPYISPSAGWIKDYIDIFLVIIFPWGGWIFFVPSIIGFWRGGGFATVTRLLLLSAIIMGTFDTLISFDSYKFGAFIKGIAHYILAFACSMLFGLIFLGICPPKRTSNDLTARLNQSPFRYQPPPLD